MSKFGVGVGEEFPVDEQNKSDEQAESGCCGHGSHEARREAWRRFRHQMHAEWHARRRAMRDAFGGREGVEAMRDFRRDHLHHLIIGGLAVVGLAALLSHLHHRD
jgi:hypothetical protein